MKEYRPPGTPLVCGCCGSYFETWPGYQNQDQDGGFGICRKCQGWIADKEEADWVKLEALVRDALNAENKVKWDGMETELRRGWICELMDRGHIQPVIRRDS